MIARTQRHLTFAVDGKLVNGNLKQNVEADTAHSRAMRRRETDLVHEMQRQIVTRYDKE
jgi:hypothetical protein